MKRMFAVAALAGALGLALEGGLSAGVISGRLTDPSGMPVQGAYTSFVRHGASGAAIAAAVTAQDGTFASINLPAGLYTQGFSEWNGFGLLYRKAVEVPTSGDAPFTELSHRPTAYCFGTEPCASSSYVYAQSFRAQGESVVSVALRCASPSSGTIAVTILDGEGPAAPPIGPTRTLPVSSAVPAYACWHSGEVPTVPGHIYTARISLEDGGPFALFRQTVRNGMRHENPDGRTWADGVETDDPLAIVVNADGGGIRAAMCCLEPSSFEIASKYAGQSFTAVGSSLLAVSWRMAPRTILCKVTLHDGVETGAVGLQIGPAKYVRPAPGSQRTVVTFAPGEAPTVPGQTYYVKLEMQDQSSLTISNTGTQDAYPGGQAFNNGAARPWDFAMGIYQEESPGSLDLPRVEITAPRVESITPDQAVVGWDTNIPADSLVEYGPRTPYPSNCHSADALSAHSMQLSGLLPNTLYHARTRSSASGASEGVSGDIVFLTAPGGANLLSNPGFESGSLAPWVVFGSGSIGPVTGVWQGGSSPRGGDWALGGAGECEAVRGGAYQSVTAASGREYRLSAWAWTLTEGGDFYSVDRQTLCAVGIDPTGGIDPEAASVVWSTPAFSQRAYCPLNVSAIAASDHVTVFVRGGTQQAIGRCVFVFDDVVLTSSEQAPIDAGLAQAARAYPDGSLLRISDAVCIATAAQVGSHYVESADRCCGLRVDTSDTMNVGDAVAVVGVLRTAASGERYLDSASVVSRDASEPIRPVCASSRSVGGSAAPPFCAGVPGSTGPYSVGTLMRVVGRVSAAGIGWVLLADGAAGGEGIKISTAALTAQPLLGQIIALTGVVRLEGTAGQTSAVLTPRGDFDVDAISGD